MTDDLSITESMDVFNFRMSCAKSTKRQNLDQLLRELS